MYFVPAVGIPSKSGAKKTATQKNNPATTVLRPVLAPALMPAADSGEIRMGGPPKNPLNIVITPHIMYNQRPLRTKK